MQAFVKNIIIIFVALFLFGTTVLAQKDKKYIREGNHSFGKNKFPDSEVFYRKAREISKDTLKPAFNIGDALYKQKKFKEATEQFSSLENTSSNKPDKSRIYHNLGNSLLQQKQLEGSIEAYKEALRNNPADLETKYNLAYAQDKLKQQKQQKKQNKNQQNKDKKNQQKNKDKKDQQNKDQQKQNQNQDQNKGQNQNQPKQQKPRPGKISKQDALRILQAMQDDEKKIQAKVKKAKAAKSRAKTTINW